MNACGNWVNLIEQREGLGGGGFDMIGSFQYLKGCHKEERVDLFSRGQERK